MTGPEANSTVGYTYDQLGRVLNRSINGIAQTNSYDNLGRLYNVVNALGSFTSTFENDSDRVLTMSLPNGQQIQNTYYGNTGDRRLQQIRNLTSTNTSISTFGYSFNAVGTISTWTQTIGTSPAQAYAVGYDNADQLKTMTAPSGNAYGYSYDPAGNRQTETINGASTSATYNPTNELTQLTPAKSGDKSYQWDAENRLIAINYAGTANQTQLKYDGLSRCTQITELTNGVATSTKRFLWCGNECCEERDSFDNATKRLFAQGEQIYGQKYFYLKDHLGSVWEMTDSTGKVRASYSFDPWGRRAKISGDLDAEFAFTGHYYHSPSSLILTLYRPYDPTTASWLSRDPLPDVEVTVGPGVFLYADNDPLNESDLLGLTSCYASTGETVMLFRGNSI